MTEFKKKKKKKKKRRRRRRKKKRTFHRTKHLEGNKYSSLHQQFDIF